MTRNSKDTIEQRIEALETTTETESSPNELSETTKEHIETVVDDALEVLTDEERARLEELVKQIDSEQATEQSSSSSDTNSHELTPAEQEYLDLICNVAPKRQLEQRMG